ncbi:hypothetical protein CGRA01v4_07673 [Colletotrichum graminicola]|nr:hypothetical protein CGRA01v4_07673 [Colletotrichum graminicola]
MLRVVSFGSGLYGASSYILYLDSESVPLFCFLVLNYHPVGCLCLRQHSYTHAPKRHPYDRVFSPWFPWSSRTSKYSEQEGTNKW